ncbi:transporter [Marinospirillum sp.]|uniref:transporter n=1 Tax=Marinospirillum sp. TaxID=2183934 RepID=UPI00384DC225
MHKAVLSLAFFILILICSPLMADRLHLSNGDTFSGRLVSYQDEQGVFVLESGSTIRIDTSQISALETDKRYQVLFNSGDRLTGQLLIDSQGQTSLRTLNQEVALELSQVTRLVRDFSQDKPTEEADTSIGEERASQPPQDFLADSAVLLAPGRFELELGLNFKQSRESHSLMNVGYFERSSFSARMLEWQATASYGLGERWEVWLKAPFTYVHIEQVSTNKYVRDTDEWRLADVSLGSRYQWIRESAATPAISFNFSLTAPTGQKNYYEPQDTWQDPLSNGNGHWFASAGMAAVRTLDPVNLFGGLTYSHGLEETIDGYEVNPGWQLSGYFGLGFALNEKISLGQRFTYSYHSRIKADGVTVYGSDREPMSLSFSASYRLNPDWVITPQITFGLNEDGGTPTASLTGRRRF